MISLIEQSGTSIGIFIQLCAFLLSAGAVYGAIRMDLKSMHKQIADIEASTNNAHQRIDSILLQHLHEMNRTAILNQHRRAADLPEEE